MNTTRATTEAARVPVKAQRRQPGRNTLLAAGYTLTDMGGNITAWRLRFGAGDLVITCGEDGSSAEGDPNAAEWMVCLYDPDGADPIQEASGLTLADAIEAGEVFRLRAAGCNA